MSKDKIPDVVTSGSNMNVVVFESLKSLINATLESRTMYVVTSEDKAYGVSDAYIGKVVPGTLGYLISNDILVDVCPASGGAFLALASDTGMIAVPDAGDSVASDGSIVCGTSEAGDAVGYHGGTGIIEDLYGEGNVTLGGLEVVQLRALGDSIRLRFANDATPSDIVAVTLNGGVVVFGKEEGQPRYNAVDAKVSKIFVEGHGITIEPYEDGIEEHKASSGKKPRASRKTKK